METLRKQKKLKNYGKLLSLNLIQLLSISLRKLNYLVGIRGYNNFGRKLRSKNNLASIHPGLEDLISMSHLKAFLYNNNLGITAEMMNEQKSILKHKVSTQGAIFFVYASTF